MQRSLRSFLSVDVADFFTGLMSGKVNIMLESFQ